MLLNSGTACAHQQCLYCTERASGHAAGTSRYVVTVPPLEPLAACSMGCSMEIQVWHRQVADMMDFVRTPTQQHGAAQGLTCERSWLGARPSPRAPGAWLCGDSVARRQIVAYALDAFEKRVVESVAPTNTARTGSSRGCGSAHADSISRDTHGSDAQRVVYVNNYDVLPVVCVPVLQLRHWGLLNGAPIR
jgi:hypothetical protein